MRQSKFVVRGVCAVGVVPVVALSMVLSGCAMDAADTGAEDLGTQHEELTLAGAGEVGEFTHLNNQNIATTFNTTCFLTEIGGAFRGGGEWAKVAQVSGNWILSIGSQQGGNNNAAAKCVYWPMTNIGTWSKGHSPVFLRNGGFCALQAVSGKFAGGGEQVKVYKDASDNWYVYGGSGTDQSLSATAGCIAVTSNYVRTQWAASNWDLNVLSDVSPTKKFCGLQQVRGAFQSSHEQLWLTIVPDQSGNTFWNLHGESQASSASRLIGGTAGCIAGSDGPIP